MTTNKKIFIGVGIVVIGVGYYFYQKIAKGETLLGTGTGEGGSSAPVSWRFLDNHWMGNVPSKLGFIGTQKPPFKAGDVVTIKQDAGAKNTGYDGATTVYSVTRVGAKWVVAVSKGYLDSSPVDGGVITM